MEEHQNHRHRAAVGDKLPRPGGVILRANVEERLREVHFLVSGIKLASASREQLFVTADLVDVTPRDIPLAVLRLHLVDGLVQNIEGLGLLLSVEMSALVQALQVHFVTELEPPKLVERGGCGLGREVSVPLQQGFDSSCELGVRQLVFPNGVDRQLQFLLPAWGVHIIDIHRVSDGFFTGDGVIVVQQRSNAEAAGILGVPGDVVDVVSVLVPREWRVLHHVERADVAVLHVALRRIENVDQVLDRMNSLPGGL